MRWKKTKGLRIRLLLEEARLQPVPDLEKLEVVAAAAAAAEGVEEEARRLPLLPLREGAVVEKLLVAERRLLSYSSREL
jgi:hypothetical protein